MGVWLQGVQFNLEHNVIKTDETEINIHVPPQNVLLHLSTKANRTPTSKAVHMYTTVCFCPPLDGLWPQGVRSVQPEHYVIKRDETKYRCSTTTFVVTSKYKSQQNSDILREDETNYPCSTTESVQLYLNTKANRTETTWKQRNINIPPQTIFCPNTKANRTPTS